MSFPDKGDREKCWSSRDVLWKCLDESGDKLEMCSQFRKLYEANCPSQWLLPYAHLLTPISSHFEFDDFAPKTNSLTRSRHENSFWVRNRQIQNGWKWESADGHTVKHFDRKREYLKFKDRIQNEGYELTDQKTPA